MGISTHILDTTRGAPAVGVAVRLEHEGRWVAEGVTDADGRVRLVTDPPATGTWRIAFAVEPYFAAQQVAAFYPEVSIAFVVRDGGHYHVPLLLNPFGYATYRGS